VSYIVKPGKAVAAKPKDVQPVLMRQGSYFEMNPQEKRSSIFRKMLESDKKTLKSQSSSKGGRRRRKTRKHKSMKRH